MATGDRGGGGASVVRSGGPIGHCIRTARRHRRGPRESALCQLRPGGWSAGGGGTVPRCRRRAVTPARRRASPAGRCDVVADDRHRPRGCRPRPQPRAVAASAAQDDVVQAMVRAVAAGGDRRRHRRAGGFLDRTGDGTQRPPAAGQGRWQSRRVRRHDRTAAVAGRHRPAGETAARARWQCRKRAAGGRRRQLPRVGRR